MAAVQHRPLAALASPSPTTLVAAGAFGFAVLAATALAHSPAAGVALVVGPCFLLLALRSVPLAAAVWVVTMYASGLPGLEAVPNRVAYVIGLCWFGVAVGVQARRDAAFPAGRAPLALALCFFAWMALSLTWSIRPADGEQQFKDFFVIGIAFLVVISAIRTPEHLRWVAVAFVAGACVSVIGGIADGGLTAAQSIGDTATSRFGAGGDPNYLAAMLVPAIAMAGGLAVRAGRGARLALLGAALLMAVGLAATQSRGGLLALGVVLLGALVLLRGRRLAVLGLVLATVCGVAAFFVANPAAWQRIHAVKDAGSGSGRTDIWQVALRVAEQHPVAGVGLAQFPNVSPQYTQRPGALSFVDLIVDQHIVVHNVYLQLWAETGLVGLLLYLGLALTALRAALRAARALDAAGDPGTAALARAVFLALLGVLAGSFFLSNILFRQIWVLLALGPALLAVARTRTAQAEALRVEQRLSDRF